MHKPMTRLTVELGITVTICGHPSFVCDGYPGLSTLDRRDRDSITTDAVEAAVDYLRKFNIEAVVDSTWNHWVGGKYYRSTTTGVREGNIFCQFLGRDLSDEDEDRWGHANVNRIHPAIMMGITELMAEATLRLEAVLDRNEEKAG